MKATNVSDFRTNMKRYLDAVIYDSASVVINRGNTGAVLISLEEYNSIKGTQAILLSERMMYSRGSFPASGNGPMRPVRSSSIQFTKMSLLSSP